MFDPDEIAARQAAALTVEKLYRGVRLCMAFEGRVVREHRRASREVEAETQKVRQDVRAKGIARIENAVSAAFHAKYEADCETSKDTEDELRTLVRHLAALGDAVTGSAASIDIDGDMAAEVERLRETALLIAKINALQAPVPEPEPPRRTRPPGLRWGGSGSG